MAKRIIISDLPTALNQLKNGKTEYNFIGITSNGVDCIYFVFENEKFNIEFEAMTEKQIPFINELKTFAASKGFHILMTTYNNKPKYISSEPAPVVRIETNSTIDEIYKIGSDIQIQIFKNNSETVYDIVP